MAVTLGVGATGRSPLQGSGFRVKPGTTRRLAFWTHMRSPRDAPPQRETPMQFCYTVASPQAGARHLLYLSLKI